MDPQITPIIDLDLIIDLVPTAKELTRRDINNGDYPNPVTNSDFFSIERNGQHLVFWLDGDNNAHRIARCRDAGRAAFIIWHMTQLVIAKVALATEPAAAAPDTDEIPLPIPSGSSQFKKSIAYDRKTGDFKVSVNGQTIGYARSNIDGETMANDFVRKSLLRAA